MAFIHPQKIMFRHCDPAGIVFYPRYFEMMNDTVEAFFEHVVEFPFSEMHQQTGVPTVGIEAQFTAPSRLGDNLKITLTCTRLGSSSLGLAYDARCSGEQRFKATSTIVFIDATGGSQPWSDALKNKLTKEVEGDA